MSKWLGALMSQFNVPQLVCCIAPSMQIERAGIVNEYLVDSEVGL